MRNVPLAAEEGGLSAEKRCGEGGVGPAGEDGGDGVQTDCPGVGSTSRGDPVVGADTQAGNRESDPRQGQGQQSSQGAPAGA